MAPTGVSMPMSQIHGKIAIEATHKPGHSAAHLRLSPYVLTRSRNQTWQTK